MRVTELELWQFRNYGYCRLAPGPHLNLVVGPNGHGKTNLLEAIWLLTGARSPRSSRPEPLIREGAQQARVRGQVELQASGAVRELEVRLHRHPAARRLWVNGKMARRPTDAMGGLVAVWVAPDASEVVRGAAERRRQFLDVALAQLDPLFRQAAVDYARVLAQRNRLLAAGASGEQAARELLEVYDGQLAQAASMVVARRRELVEELEPLAREYHRELAGQGAGFLELRYRCSVSGSGSGGPAEGQDYPARLAARLRSLRAAELARGVTLVGPHRDDVAVLVGGVEVRHFGSRGQQRSVALAMHLALWECVARRCGEAPVLLVDDAPAELDEGRRARLVGLLPRQAQVLVSATEAELLGPLRARGWEVPIWEVRDGSVAGPRTGGLGVQG